MKDEPFHVSGQEWRYYSRQKSLSNTLHLSQLPTGTLPPGESIPVLQPPDISQKYGQTPLQFPSGIGTSVKVFNTYNQFVASDAYGCVGTEQDILARKNVTIEIDGWTSALMQVTMTCPPGTYLIHLECQTDLRTLGYQGPNNDGHCDGNVAIDGTLTQSCSMTVLMVGASWGADLYMDSVGHSSTTFIADVAGGTVVFQGVNLGDPAAAIPACISCFILKIDKSS